MTFGHRIKILEEVSREITRWRSFQVERSPRACVQVGEDWACVRDTQGGQGLEQRHRDHAVSRSREGRPDGARCAVCHHVTLSFTLRERRSYGEILQRQRVTLIQRVTPVDALRIEFAKGAGRE